jgi:ATP-binding cassette, subfamily B, bacterial PglK
MRVKKIKDLVVPFGKKRLVAYGLFVLLQAIVGIVAVFAVSPLMQVVFGKEKSIHVLGLNLDFIYIVIVFVLAQCVLCLVNVSTDFMRAHYIAKFNEWLRVSLLKKVIQRNYAYFTSNESAIIQQSVNMYAINIGILLNNYLEFLTKVAITCAFLLIAVFLSPLLAAIVAGLGVAYYLCVIKLFKELRLKINQKLDSANNRMQSLSLQMIQGIKMLRISEKTDFFLQRYGMAASDYARYSAYPNVIGTIPKYFVECLLMLVIAIYLYYLYSLEKLEETLPGVGVILFIAFKVFPLLQAIYSNFNFISTNTFVLDRVHETYFHKDNISTSDKLVKLTDNISIDHLRYRFSENDAYLEFPSFTIKKGETVGIKGPSGSGKSTLLNILLGFYKAQSGRILVDGEEMSDADLRTMHSLIGYVGQDPFLLHASIAENVSLETAEKQDNERIKRACQLAEIDIHIESLSEKYETIVGDMGVRLSGGQKQRIAIARALYKEPSILYLDEATSALDEETERKIMDTVYSLPEGMTILMIAHRLSTLERADRIIEIK